MKEAFLYAIGLKKPMVIMNEGSHKTHGINE